MKLAIRRRRRASIVLAAAAAALCMVLFSAPTALGSSVNQALLVIAAPGEQNVITVTQSGGSFVITDTVGIGTDAPFCNQDSATQVTCGAPPSGFQFPGIDAGDLDDRVQLNLSSNNTGFLTSPQVIGGDGNDTLDASASLSGSNIYGDAYSGPGATGSGNDLIIGSPRQDVAIAGPGDDRVLGNDGHDFLKGGEGADVLEGGEGDDLIITLLDPTGSSTGPSQPGFVDDNTVDTVTCGGNTPPAALLPGEAPRNPNYPPTDGAQTGQGDLVATDCEEVLAVLTCPSGTCEGLPTVTTTAAAAAATAVASAAGKGKTQVLGRARRKVKVKKGQKLIVNVRMDRKKVKKALGKRSSLPAKLGLQNRKSKRTGRKIKFKLKR
jgi:Ca2+-binding RTX toxin-like protein